MTKYLPGLIALALLGILVLQWTGWPPPTISPEPDPEAGVATDPASASSSPDLMARLESKDSKDSKDNYASIIEQPLFRPDRKPEPPPDEDPASATGPEENVDLKALDLNAVLITPALASAWIRDPSQPKLRRLRIGDDLQGWSVRDILEDRVLLERQGKQDALILRDYVQTPPAPAPTANPRRPPRAPVRAAPPKP
ncbi:type II secretion system protein N [Thiocystis violacea]|uniref:type II secretion system protein N n=1 Tax=Thiocystis violacea TaxID=13725 RepID=UPI001904E7F2|nr:type II secretion system protein N [Thiocystis violacea]MBK1717422.1 hypothetical protein [Thiocystis violacea]